MLATPTCEWFAPQLKRVKDRPGFLMESYLYRFEEVILSVREPKGIDKLFYRLFQWSARKLIDRFGG